MVATKDGFYDPSAKWVDLGNGQYVQQLAKLDLDLVAYIRASTSNYTWAAFPVAPDHDWSKTPSVSDEVRDRLSGRVLDTQGGFRSSVLVDGEAFNPRFLPCGDASCVASGAGIDLKDPETQRWISAGNTTAAKDALAVGSLAPLPMAWIGKVLGSVFGKGVASEAIAGGSSTVVAKGLGDVGGTKGGLGRVEPPIPKVDVTNDFMMSVSNTGGTTLRYGNPEGVAGLVVNVDKAGVLGFEIRAAQNHPFYDASGTDMFSSAMQRLGNEGIQVNQIRGAWEAGTDSVNTAQYMQNISKGMSKESAALNTWTGQISQKYGYAKVEKIETIGEITYVTFGK
ncbi:hypothetical protein SAMN04490185_2541 [Pseudomonas frederiksbergensis]|uniref:Uncharacterized protein n=1 Tax=Pseudomonas frederiksbergensis TaxID=104087 RepID=A0A1H4X472_9PSED|nr:hypothetical protein [Pseudomonas frederiksbergensis]SED00325.1 hypothetical protein SAMN04490185_2541 [Pseudomonas frederiksbergensis]